MILLALKCAMAQLWEKLNGLPPKPKYRPRDRRRRHSRKNDITRRRVEGPTEPP